MRPGQARLDGRDDRAALAVLTWAASPPDRELASLLGAMGPAAALRLIQSAPSLPGLAPGSLSRWQAALREAPGDGGAGAAASLGFRLVVPGDPGWPGSLDGLGPTRPLALWVRGAELPGVGTAVAVDGSRAATTYGSRMAARIAAGLAENGVAVITCGAGGIGLAAHRAALSAGGMTVAVVANPGAPLPPAYAALMEAIEDHSGTVVTEQPPGHRATLWQRASRARVIAALAAGTVIVESPSASPAMDTAGYARELGRAVMAVPGPADSATFRGCHQLIRGGAELVASAQDVLDATAARIAALRLRRQDLLGPTVKEAD